MDHRLEADLGFGQDDQRRVQDFLTGHGWVPGGSAELVPGVGAPVLDFRVPGCLGVVRVGLLPASGEMASLFAQTAPPDARVFYLHRGRTSGEPPRLAYVASRIAGLMAALRLWPRASSPVVAVSQPSGCRLEAALPWSEL